MQRDMELFRKVLFKVEELPFDGGARQVEVEGYDDENTTYHVKLALDAGFINAQDVSNLGGKAYLVSAHALAKCGCRERVRRNRRVWRLPSP